MMSHAKQLQIYKERGQLAPEEFIQQLQLIQFEETVAEMRGLQKLYFAKRDKSVLAQSKRVECHVDSLLEQMGYTDQGQLFP
jgi:hypothetical protein